MQGIVTKIRKIEMSRWSRGHVVVMASFLIQMITFGISGSIGLYNIEFLDTFRCSSAAVSFVGSINLGMFLGSGPIVSAAMRRWNHRKVAMFGAALSSFGLLCMPFAANLPYMYLFYGVLTGLGNGFVYTSSHVLSGLYFRDCKSLSTGIAASGRGLGQAIFPFIVQGLIEHFLWRGSILILAGVNLHLLVLACLLKPLCHKHNQTTFAIPQKRNATMHLDTTDNCTVNLYVYCIEVKQGLGVADTTKTNRNNQTRAEYQAKKEKKIDVNGMCRFALSRTGIVFLIFYVNNIFWGAGIGIILEFLPKYMVYISLSKQDACVALALRGVGLFVGSLCGGMFGNATSCYRLKLYVCGNIVLGVSVLLFCISYLQTILGQLFLAFALGVSNGIVAGLLMVLTYDLVGIKSFDYGFGALLLANGTGLLIGPAIAGAFVDATGIVESSIYVSGSITTTGGILMCLVLFIGNWKTKRQFDDI